MRTERIFMMKISSEKLKSSKDIMSGIIDALIASGNIHSCQIDEVRSSSRRTIK